MNEFDVLVVNLRVGSSVVNEVVVAQWIAERNLTTIMFLVRAKCVREHVLTFQ